VVLGAAEGGAGVSRGLGVGYVRPSSAVTGAEMKNPTENIFFCKKKVFDLMKRLSKRPHLYADLLQ
jgi:hypothetical protein